MGADTTVQAREESGVCVGGGSKRSDSRHALKVLLTDLDDSRKGVVILT